MCRDVQALLQKPEMQKGLWVSSRNDKMNFILLHYIVYHKEVVSRVTQKHMLFAVHYSNRPGTYHTERNLLFAVNSLD